MLIPENISVIEGGGEQECQMFVYYGNGITVLADILDKAPPDAIHSVVIDYNDSDGNSLSRTFKLTFNLDRTVSWMPGPVRQRAERLLSTP